MLRLATVVLLAVACGGSSGDPDMRPPHDWVEPPPFCTDGADGGPAPTLASVEEVTRMNCAVSSCHDGPGDPFQASPMMDLRPGHVYASWVNVMAVETCGGVRVVPGQPASSYVFHKLTDDTPCKESQMPRCEVGACPLPPCQIEIIRKWIALGAPPR